MPRGAPAVAGRAPSLRAALFALPCLLLPALAAAQPAPRPGPPQWATEARDCVEGDRTAYVTFVAILAGGAGRLAVHRANGNIDRCDHRYRAAVYPNLEAGRAPPADAWAFSLDRPPCAAAQPALDRAQRAIGWFAPAGCWRR